MIQGIKARGKLCNASRATSGRGGTPPCRAAPPRLPCRQARTRAQVAAHPRDRNVKLRVDINAQYAMTRVPDLSIKRAPLRVVRAMRHTAAAAPYERSLNGAMCVTPACRY